MADNRAPRIIIEKDPNDVLRALVIQGDPAGTSGQKQEETNLHGENENTPSEAKVSAGIFRRAAANLAALPYASRVNTVHWLNNLDRRTVNKLAVLGLVPVFVLTSIAVVNQEGSSPENPGRTTAEASDDGGPKDMDIISSNDGDGSGDLDREPGSAIQPMPGSDEQMFTPELTPSPTSPATAVQTAIPTEADQAPAAQPQTQPTRESEPSSTPSQEPGPPPSSEALTITYKNYWDPVKRIGPYFEHEVATNPALAEIKNNWTANDRAILYHMTMAIVSVCSAGNTDVVRDIETEPKVGFICQTEAEVMNALDSLGYLAAIDKLGALSDEQYSIQKRINEGTSQDTDSDQQRIKTLRTQELQIQNQIFAAAALYEVQGALQAAVNELDEAGERVEDYDQYMGLVVEVVSDVLPANSEYLADWAVRMHEGVLRYMSEDSGGVPLVFNEFIEGDSDADLRNAQMLANARRNISEYGDGIYEIDETLRNNSA